MADLPLTTTDIVAAASSYLEAGGYSAVAESRLGGWELPSTRVFEDPYSVVALMVYESWADLASNWTAAQAALVQLMSDYMTSADPKAWEGYLVLLTPGTAPEDGSPSVSDLRYDVSRVRKLIATGDELTQTSEVERALLPLLPMRAPASAMRNGSVLDLLPALLADHGIDRDAVRVIIDAFTAQQPLVESLHHHRNGT